MTPHKHKDVIVAWAHGHKIQVWNDQNWIDCNDPRFLTDCIYRVKPTKIKMWLFIYKYEDKFRITNTYYKDEKRFLGFYVRYKQSFHSCI